VRSDWEIVGVMPEGFTYPIGSGLAGAVDIWMPVVPRPQDLVRDQGRTYNLSVVGRLRRGETLERADAQMRVIHASLATQYPDWFADRGILVRRLQDAVVGTRVRDWMLFLLGAVGFVLLIACLNVANLLLARATARAREVAVRSALGARRWDLSRALLVESLMLAMLGAIGGILLAFWAVTVLRATLPENLPRLAMVAVDFRVLGVTALASIATGVGFGMLPALHVGRADVAGTLRQSGRSHTSGSGKLRTTLVGVEIASAVVLLTGAALFLASFIRVMRVDLGLDPRHVMAVSLAPAIISSADLAPSAPSSARTEVVSAQTLTMAALERAKAVPGVTAISALTLGLPLSGNSLTASVVAPGRVEPFTGEDELWLHGVGAGYLDVVRGRLLGGRWIADSDTSGSPPVVVLSEDAVRRYFGSREPIGQTIQIEGFARMVVGVVGNMRLAGPERPIQPEGYIPYLQTDQKNADLVFRTGPDPAQVLPGLLAAIRAVVPKAAAGSAETIERHFGRIVAQRKFNMVVLVLFGVVAIVIAAVGIYGLMAHLVAQRTREIGVRIALGAAPARILEMVLRRATFLLSTGLAAGLLAAGALERFVRSFLFEAAPHDPRIYAAVAAALLVVGLAAAAGPARRAARVDPLVALRTD
jgi:predicted permease